MMCCKIRDRITEGLRHAQRCPRWRSLFSPRSRPRAPEAQVVGPGEEGLEPLLVR